MTDQPQDPTSHVPYNQGAPHQNPYSTPPQPMSPADEKLWATLVHLGGIFLGFLSPLIGYLVLKDRGPFVRQHTATALNFQLTVLIVYVAGTFLSWLIFPMLAVAAAFVLSIVLSIVAAIAANNGQFYRYPASIEFVK